MKESSIIFTGRLTNIVQICCGRYHNVGLSDEGCVWTWGLGNDQLGKDNENCDNPNECAFVRGSYH